LGGCGMGIASAPLRGTWASIDLFIRHSSSGSVNS
jgi:hypothetical protein